MTEPRFKKKMEGSRKEISGADAIAPLFESSKIEDCGACRCGKGNCNCK